MLLSIEIPKYLIKYKKGRDIEVVTFEWVVIHKHENEDQNDKKVDEKRDLTIEKRWSWVNPFHDQNAKITTQKKYR